MNSFNINQGMVNKGKPCIYKNDIYYIVYESDKYAYITKSKNLQGNLYAVQIKKIKYGK